MRGYARRGIREARGRRSVVRGESSGAVCEGEIKECSIVQKLSERNFRLEVIWLSRFRFGLTGYVWPTGRGACLNALESESFSSTSCLEL